MTISSIGNSLYLGLSTDTKPTGAIVGAIFVETDTGITSYHTSTAWIPMDSVLLSPAIKKVGWTMPSGPAANLSKTGICALTVDAGTITNVWNVSEGTVSQFVTGTTQNSNGGQTSPISGTGAGRRSTLGNLRLKTRIAIDSTSASRVYAGFTSNTVLPKSDIPLASGESGVIVGFRTTDANWSVFRNDGTTGLTVTSLGVAKNTNFNTIEIIYNGSTSVDVKFNGVTTNFTTILPSTSTNQYYNVVGQNSTTTSKTLTYSYMIVDGL